MNTESLMGQALCAIPKGSDYMSYIILSSYSYKNGNVEDENVSKIFSPIYIS